MAVEPTVLRATMRQWATGVTVVTTALGEERGGMTVSSFTSVSLEPPTVLVCLNKKTYCHDLVHRSGVYAVSMLGQGQDTLANRFAGLDPTVFDRFEGIEVTMAETGSPLLPDAIAHLDCIVRSTHETTTHTIFIAEVVFAEVDPDKAPLVYHNRSYHALTALEFYAAMIDEYAPEEQAQLLGIARHTLEVVAAGKPRPPVTAENLPPRLREERACFVTFHIDRELRGCTGTLAARRPLAEEVAVTTMQTAFNDPRFPPVSSAEVPQISIELSVLTPSTPLKFKDADDLLRLLRPGIDGVTLRLGLHRSTFLPQVWERVPNPTEFLTMLSRKMGLPGDAWQRAGMEVETYQTITMEEPAVCD